jgi:hypothetical protein
VQRRVQRRLRGPLARLLLEPRADLLECERVVAEVARVPLDERECRFGALLVAVDGRRLAAPDEAVVLDLDLDDVLPVARLAGDHERLGEVQADDSGAHLHRRGAYCDR